MIELLTIGVGNVTTMPDKAHRSIVNLTKHGRVGAAGVSIPHVIDDSDRERLGVTGFRSGLEGQDVRLRGAIAGSDLVVVRLGAGKVFDLHVVEVLAALRGGEQGAGRCAIVSGWS